MVRAAMVQRQNSGGWAEALQGVKSCAVSIASQVRITQCMLRSGYLSRTLPCDCCLAWVHGCVLWSALSGITNPNYMRSRSRAVCNM